MNNFTQLLLAWWDDNKRNLPWKDTHDAYTIWLSEIILQQTRVEQGLPYFERLTTAFPTVTHLANAPEDQLMHLWEGLGYYSRARNLHATAKHIAFTLDGVFPNTYETIMQLKGIGPYTAAAIASFAFGLPHAVVDGNVFRVLARYFNINTPIDSTEGKKQFTELANRLLPPSQAANYNQALMDFGALQCKPANPLCHTCPLQPYCAAYKHQTVDLLPIKAKKMVRKTRFFNYLVINIAQNTPDTPNICIRKRTDSDIWQNLYEFPMIETTDTLLDTNQLINQKQWQNWFADAVPIVTNVSKIYEQLLTHQHIKACFWQINLPENTILPNNWQTIHPTEVTNYAFPKVLNTYAHDYWIAPQKQQSLF